MEYTDLNAEIIPLIGGVADPSIIRTVRNVAIDFAKRTKVLTRTETLIANGHTVALTASGPDERVYTFNTVKYMAQPITVRGESTGMGYQVILPDSLPANSTVEVQYVTIPTRNSQQCDERILDDWYETIVAGTLSNLYAMKTASWFDSGMSESYAANYAQGIFEATAHERNEDTRTTHYMTYGGL